MTETITDGPHDSLVATYQVLELARLNDVLKEAGIGDVGLRRKICENFFFHSGYFLDSCWFADEGGHYRPVVCFVEVDSAGRPLERVHFPDPTFGTMFHEYASGNASWLFDDHAEDASEIETGELSP